MTLIRFAITSAWIGILAVVTPLPAQADFAAGMVAARQGDFATALAEWTPLAEAGDRDAQANLALMYDQGAGVEPDPLRALDLFLAAADQGHSLAAYRAGLAYQMGKGVPVDPGQAVRWFRVSAENGYPGGIYELGYSYHQGEGVAADSQEALKWFYVAAALSWGNAIAARNFTEKELSAEQIEAASQSADAWLAAHPDILPQGR